MSSVDVPLFGTLVLCASLVVAAYAFAVSLAAGRGRPHMLGAARWGTYAAVGLVILDVAVLAYAFQTHDFRIRYVAHYSDRTMAWWYLIASLWGGQDGSMLWWAFLLAVWTALCVRWMRGRFVELQPWVLATLLSILMFFQVTMLFAANPFATSLSGAPVDGQGLNPLLQNYWMIIHPPTLYMGFVGWSVPFAFAVAALITGRLHDEWVKAVRKWVLVAWLFLSIGLLLGSVWSYEELGWGGYWAWDPVENASFMPWLVGTAYIHSVVVQERYGMLKVWNVFLMCLTFLMTIFGTFLTRSGLIASVHSFARSDIGVYFAWYLVFLLLASAVLMIIRLPRLKADHRIQSLLSREFAFLLNNWILLAMMGFVLVLTTLPLLSQAFMNEEMTVGPPVYNAWMVPFGLVLLFLCGVGPLISWRKATGRNLLKAFAIPLVAMVVVGLAHAAVGRMVGFPAYVAATEIYDTFTGKVLAALFGVSPVVSTSLSAFVIAAVVQEFWRGTLVRMRARGETAPVALYELVSRAKRRYGGYVVHLAIVLMYIGFTGAAYDTEKEASLAVGDVMEVGSYQLRYEGARDEEDPNKRMLFTDLTVMDADGDHLGIVSPARFVYRTHPEMPTTEVAIRSGLIEDLYVIMSTADPRRGTGTFRVIVRPLVIWIWIGFVLLIIGTLIAAAPSVEELVQLGRIRPRRGAAAAALGMVVLAAALGLPGRAVAQESGSSSLHAGTVIIEDPVERKLFERLLCMCGDCERLPLSSCTCSWASDMRARLRGRLAGGESVPSIIETYRQEQGSAALSIPPDEGLSRAAWVVPILLIAAAAVLIVVTGRRWQRKGAAAESAKGAATPGPPGERNEYDDAIDEELARLEGDE